MTQAGRRWHFPHLPDWSIYAAIVAALIIAALGRRENADAPPAPPPLSSEEGKLLPSASTFAPQVVVKVSADPSGPMSGTAFSIAPAGVWLTARHVVAGCSKVALMEAPGKAAAARVIESPPDAPATDVAVLTTQGGAPALPLAPNGGLRIGERGFHPGFPQDRAGEVTTRLLGRQTLEFHARSKIGLRAGHAESVLSWAEAGRTGGLRGDLAGLSGAPVLDARGQVVGVTLAEAPRRGRIYAAPFDAIREALREAKVAPLPPAQLRDPISVDNYGRAADDLRRDLSVAQVVCLDGG
jgi:S1-C subfamily serine protease